MTLKQKAIKGVMWNVLESWCRRIFSYVVFFTLARLLLPEDFGLIALATTFISFASIFVNQGFTTALVQRSELELAHLDTAFWTNLSLGIVFTLATVGFSGFIAEAYQQPKLSSVICWLSLVFLINAFKQVQEAVLTRKLCFKLLAIRSLVVSCIGGIAGIIAAFSGLGVWSLVVQQLLGETLGVIVLWQASDWRPGLKFSLKHLNELFSFGINLVGISLLNFVTSNSDNLLIGYFLGPVALGYYTLAYKVYQLILQLLTSIADKVAMPIFSRIQENLELLRSAFYRVIQLTSLLAFPLCIGTVILAPEIIAVMFGENWLPSVPVMQILGIVGVLHCVFQFKVTVITALGKPSWVMWSSALNAFADFLLFAFVVRWGIVAVALAYALRTYLLSPIRLWMIYKLAHINIKTYLSQYIAPFLGSLAMITSIFAIKYFLSSLIGLRATLIISILSAMFTYGLVIALIAPQLWKQITKILQIAYSKAATT